MKSLTYSFKNSGEQINNDVVYPDLFELSNHTYTFLIRPKTKFWRFGIRLSKTEDVKFYHPTDRYKSPEFWDNYIDIHLGIGEWDETNWTLPKRIYLVQYNLKDYDHIINRQETYVELGEIEWQFSYNQNKKNLTVSYTAEGCKPFAGVIEIPENYEYFKVFAWADKIEFEIESTIRIISLLEKNGDNNSKTKNYWLLKLNAKKWEIENFNIPYDAWFHSHTRLEEERIEYDLFKAVQEGDEIIGYAFGDDYNAVVCVFQVTEPLSLSSGLEEKIKFTIIKMVDPNIPFDSFKDKVSFAEDLNEDSPIRLIHLDIASYKQILDSNPLVNTKGTNTHPFYSPEGDFGKTEDQLEFNNDIESFASVISLKEVISPLAIGLFGKWGAGKSFFMHKLRERINAYSKRESDMYVKNVVHVEFNSWHYSDTNLWASLTTQIFGSLNDFAQDNKIGDQAIEEIYKKLEITNYQIQETKNKIRGSEIEIESLKEQEGIIQKEIDIKKATLTLWNTGDLLKIVLSDQTIQTDFENLKNEFISEKLINDISEINARFSEVDTVWNRILKSFNLLRDNRKGNWRWVWGTFFTLIIVIFLITFPLRDWATALIKDFAVFISGILFLTTGIKNLSPYFQKITKFYKQLNSIKQTIEREKAKTRLKEDITKQKLQTDIDNLISRKLIFEKDLQNKEFEKSKLENEIKEIGSGKALSDFLIGRSIDDNYLKQLGIISLIRKDFAKLNDLFKQQRKINKTDNKELPGNITKDLQIDRIILYIDDLDRCNEDVVVKVLEAIHLLLAFPLFVVIVGVDPRWLNKALNKKLTLLHGSDNLSNDKLSEELNEKSDSLKAATSYDYLEKIFQIPFALKPINKTGREKLLANLIKAEMKSQSPKKQIENLNPEEINNPSLGQGSENQKEKIFVNDAVKEPEKLTFSRKELAFMQKVSVLFGQTPRGIHRYVNIYRLIKSHKNLQLSTDFSEEDFIPPMVVLSIVVGCSEVAKKFISELYKADDAILFNEFLKTVKIPEEHYLFLSTIDELSHIPVESFKRNLELISRFSFRVLIED